MFLFLLVVCCFFLCRERRVDEKTNFIARYKWPVCSGWNTVLMRFEGPCTEELKETRKLFLGGVQGVKRYLFCRNWCQSFTTLREINAPVRF